MSSSDGTRNGTGRRAGEQRPGRQGALSAALVPTGGTDRARGGNGGNRHDGNNRDVGGGGDARGGAGGGSRGAERGRVGGARRPGDRDDGGGVHSAAAHHPRTRATHHQVRL